MPVNIGTTANLKIAFSEINPYFWVVIKLPLGPLWLLIVRN